ncbi:MAG: hypothetical protein ACXWL2_04235 [Candidatus Chromulinivorax sp.]
MQNNHDFTTRVKDMIRNFIFIKEFIKIERNKNEYYPLYFKKIQNINYLAIFFYDAFRYIYKFGVIEFINKLKNNDRSGMSSEMIELNMDNENNLAYISEPYDNSANEITPEIEQFIDQLATIELCHRNFIGYVVMTKENLFHLLITWEQLKNKKNSYILLYQDDNNWYDSVSFDTEESMNQFIIDHIKVI